MRSLIAFKTLILFPSVCGAMSDTTAGAQRAVKSAFILPLIRQITQTMDLVSRGRNSIPTVDSEHLPFACVDSPALGEEIPL